MRRSQRQIATQCIAETKAAFDGHATISYCDRRSSTPSCSVSTIILETEFIATIIRDVRSEDLVTYCQGGVQIVARATHDQARTIADRLTGITGANVLDIRTIRI